MDATARRPGGRSARVRTAVHGSTVRLLTTDRWREVTLATVARDAAVQPSSVYRRWGTLDVLLDDVVDELLAGGSPLPDTGTLDGDVRAWARSLAEDLSGQVGLVMLRAAVLRSRDAATASVAGRSDEIERMLARARDRGEAAPDLIEVFELLVSPLYAYALFRPEGLQRFGALAERLLGAARQHAPTR